MNRLIDSYKITKGYCYIFDNYDFENTAKNRVGSQQDSQKFKEAFEQKEYGLNYNVEVIPNLKAKEMTKELNIISRKIKNNILRPNPLVLIFLSHGQESVIAGTDNELIYVSQIMSIFSDNNCPQLKDVLKLIIINACRGGESTKSIYFKGVIHIARTQF